jgi:RNA polymerase sigma-70 factor (ECF subfamily)
MRQPETRVDSSEERTATASGPAADNIDTEDAQLAVRCQAGDLRAYERLYALYGVRMRSLARNLLGSAADADDAVQETFLKVQRSIGGFRGQSSFATWTFRILVNTCHDQRRSRMRRSAEQPIADGSAEEAPAAPEPRAAGSHPALKLALERALGQLTKHQREVFVLYEVEGFRHAEIAMMLNTSETASKNTLFQAKKNLRQMLEPPRAASRPV